MHIITTIFERMRYFRFPINILVLCCFLLITPSCTGQPNAKEVPTLESFQTGAEQFSEYSSLLEGKKVALVVNATSKVGDTHLLDLLLLNGIEVVKIFAPEHGFRGEADAGEKVDDTKDAKTGLPIISLYGKHKKPTTGDLDKVDVVVFDIQDVGVRFYTYISTLHLVMEACAENSKKLVVLDKPNPNGHFVDGYVREAKYESFVGMHPIPVVHGMTIGEYALMINGEAWLSNEAKCDLSVVPCLAYNHNMPYQLPIKPSPNLPNASAIAHYPSICFFEGTQVSVGRGTPLPFQCYGNPKLDEVNTSFSFVPESKPGAKYPKHQNERCYGFSLENKVAPDHLDLSHLILMYNLYPNKEQFFLESGFFELLAGTLRLREALEAGMSEEEIRASWADEVEAFKQVRKKYLLYKDFE